MEFYSVDAKPFKRIYFQSIAYNVVGILAAFTLVRNGFFILPRTFTSEGIVWGLIGLFIVLNMQHTRRVKSKMAEMSILEDFESKVQAYEKIFRFRTMWFLFACLLSCMLFVITSRTTFLYWSIIDLIFLLPLYPGLTFLKKELGNDDIILY